MSEHSHEPVTLSERGGARREAILRALHDEAERAVERRGRRRRLAATAASLVVVVGVVLALPRPAPTPMAPAIAAPARIEVAMVATDPNAAERLRLSITTSRQIVVIDDAELVRVLAELGRPAGVARMGERVVLSREVADASIGDSGPGAG